MLAEILSRLDAFAAKQRDTEARMDRMERGDRALTQGGEPGRVEELPEEGTGGETKGKESTKSPFPEDQGYNYQDLGQEPPFPEILEAKPNEIGVKVTMPDLYATEMPAGQDPEAERRIIYCSAAIHWMVMADRERPVWIPSDTYKGQGHNLLFAMCMQPQKPQQVTDIRMWLPPSSRQQGTVRDAIQGLLAQGKVKQKAWGKGVLLYVGGDPKFRVPR